MRNGSEEDANETVGVSDDEVQVLGYCRLPKSPLYKSLFRERGCHCQTFAHCVTGLVDPDEDVEKDANDVDEEEFDNDEEEGIESMADVGDGELLGQDESNIDPELVNDNENEKESETDMTQLLQDKFDQFLNTLKGLGADPVEYRSRGNDEADVDQQEEPMSRRQGRYFGDRQQQGRGWRQFGENRQQGFMARFGRRGNGPFGQRNSGMQRGPQGMRFGQFGQRNQMPQRFAMLKNRVSQKIKAAKKSKLAFLKKKGAMKVIIKQQCFCPANTASKEARQEKRRLRLEKRVKALLRKQQCRIMP